tara:strand:+ start:262 stop:369 length:108 start_codon:yes stop_codon:yes gene_type:complete
MKTEIEYIKAKALDGMYLSKKEKEQLIIYYEKKNI